VDEVASASEAAASLFREGVAALGFVRSIVFHVYPKLLRSVGELALVAIGTVPLFHEIFAKRALGF